jgi:hypothetical protein
MKNTKLIALLIAATAVVSASAYYDTYGTWHDDVITETLDTVTGGRYSDAPQDKEERKKAARELEDKKRAANRKYTDKQEKIQRKKEDRRYKNRY